MRFLRVEKSGMFGALTEDKVGEIPSYAILSHTWGADQDEVTLKDLAIVPRMDKSGYRKLEFCAEQAAKDDLQYIWIDTCCIDKTNNTELHEAINSMFHWYQRSVRCYVFLSDVLFDGEDPQAHMEMWESQFRRSRWFTRGWTLQELLAPASVEFFSASGVKLGDKKSLGRHLQEITGIPSEALHGTALSKFPIHERFSWMAIRQTKREEDMAYSLLGIFDVYIPLIYGEGKDRALRRLQDEIDKNSHAVQDTILLNSLPDAVDAHFNSYRRQHEALCLAGTRVRLLEVIQHWVDQDDANLIFWLDGLAGTGKSTISRTIARKYFDENRLGASFFFSRCGGDVGHADKFVTTIALQLARTIPELHNHIVDSIKQRSDIASRSLHDQWQELVLRPMSKLMGKTTLPSYLVIVDALDECANESDVQVLLHLLSQTQTLTKVRLRILLTSRPEVPIGYGFSQVSREGYRDFVLHNIEQSIVDQDIYLYLKYNFGIIRRERFLEVSWPGERILRYLVKVSSGLFIWAATACRYIREGKRFAPRRLEYILQNSQGVPTAPEKHLDEIYGTVLRQTISPEYTSEEKVEVYTLLRKILGSIITLLSPLCVTSLSRLIHVPKEEADQTLSELHSILDIPVNHDLPLRLHHPSFRDFLVNKDRCTDANFYVNEAEMHHTLTEQCLEIMSQALKRDICDLQDFGMASKDVDSSRISLKLSREVQYSCVYWVQHLERSKRRLRDDSKVHKFLSKSLLHWLEAMTLLGKVPEAMYALDSLKEMATNGECPKLSNFVFDARRFVSYSRAAFENHPLQLYCSALAFTPEKSMIRQTFEWQLPRWMDCLPHVRDEWSALIQTLEGQHKDWRATCISHDSKLIASASIDGLIRICDAATGVERTILPFNSDIIMTMAFSPDAELLALATKYRTIRIWDAVTGVEKFCLQGHQSSVTVVAFTSDAKFLASGSLDTTVRIWDVVTGTMLHTLHGHGAEIATINFVFGDKTIATTSKDKSEVKFWSMVSGVLEETRGPFEKDQEVSEPMALSRTGKLLASKTQFSIITIWDIDTGEELWSWRDHEMITSVAISPDEKLAVTGSFETVRAWSILSGGLKHNFTGHKGWISEVVFAPNGKMLATASNDQSIKLWDLTVEETLNIKNDGHRGWVNILAFSPKGTLLASAAHDNTLQLWDVSMASSEGMLGKHDAWINDLAFSPDGRLLASAGDKTIKIWNVHNNREERTLSGHKEWMTNVMFSPDNRSVASISIDKNVIIWDLSTGTSRYQVEGAMTRLESPLSFSLTTGDSTHVSFANHSHFDINFFWLDIDGISKHYWTLKPSQEITQQTFVGHFWRFVNAKTCQTIGAYTGVAEHVRCVITDDDIAAIEGNKQYLQEKILQSGMWPFPAAGLPEDSRSPFTIHDNWIVVQNTGKRLMWLPDEYRPTYYKMRNDTLVLGHASGRVTFLNIRVSAIRSNLHEYFPFLVKSERVHFADTPGLLVDVD